MNGAKVQYNFDLALISVYIKRRIILSLLIRLRCSGLATRSDGIKPEIGIDRKK